MKFWLTFDSWRTEGSWWSCRRERAVTAFEVPSGDDWQIESNKEKAKRRSERKKEGWDPATYLRSASYIRTATTSERRGQSWDWGKGGFQARRCGFLWCGWHRCSSSSTELYQCLERIRCHPIRNYLCLGAWVVLSLVAADASWFSGKKFQSCWSQDNWVRSWMGVEWV